MLLYCLGPDAEDVLVSTNINSEERKKFCDVVKKHDDFLKVRRNVRARFNRRSQLDGETVDQYIAVLHNLAENCDYGMLSLNLSETELWLEFGTLRCRNVFSLIQT